MLLQRICAAGVAMMMVPALALGALAQSPPDKNGSATPGVETQNGRYAMTPAPNGFLRLDTRSGAVSLCTLKNNQVTCAVSADERGALDAEIDRLVKENSELRRKLAAATDQAPAARLRNALPTEQEMNKALSFAEQFMRRMMRVMREETPKGDRL